MSNRNPLVTGLLQCSDQAEGEHSLARQTRGAHARAASPRRETGRTWENLLAEAQRERPDYLRSHCKFCKIQQERWQAAVDELAKIASEVDDR